MTALECWNCGQDLSAEPLPISRHASCVSCGEVLHCCRFCTQYDTNRPGSCNNDLADPPSEKTIANFCEYFSLNRNAYRGPLHQNDRTKAKLASLFGDEVDQEISDSGNTNPLDDLFKD